jgi:hypothetical protein
MWVILNQEAVNDGALPRKRWEPVEGEKSHKLSYKPSKAYKDVCSPKAYNEGRAVAYALWLVERDRRRVPEGSVAIAQWSTITSHTQLDKHGNAKVLPRVCSVIWRKRKTSWDSTPVGPVLMSVSIPHWDWEPRVSVEDGPPCANVKSAQWLSDFLSA